MEVAPGPELRVSVQPRGGWVVVVVAGELDYHTCPELTSQLEAVTEGRHPIRVAVDLAGLEYGDSSALRCLISAWRKVRGGGGELLLLRPSGWFGSMLRRTGLGEVLVAADDLPGG